MSARLRCAWAAALLCVACSGGGGATQDAGRFDVREASLAPVDVVGINVDIVAPSVDVRGADASVSPDGPSSDGSEPPAACVAVANEHAEAVRDAQRCLRDSDCDTLLCETLCCACEVYVNGAAAEAGAAREIAARADARGCVTSLRCPRVPCDAATRALCSSAGRCVTLRGAALDAGVLDAMP